MQLAKALGLRVVATAGTEEGLELLRRLGADKVANHREEDSVAKVVSLDLDDWGSDVSLLSSFASNVSHHTIFDILFWHS